MKTNRFLPLLTLAALGISAGSPACANTVSNASEPVATAPASAVPNQVVYKAQLPTAQEITNAASAQGLTVEQIDQVAGRITAVYKTPNGQTMTVAYTLLPNSGATAAGSQAVVAPDATLAAEGSASEVPVEEVTAAPSTTVVYAGSPYYYDPLFGPYYGYYPYGVGIGLGIGFHSGYYHGGYYHGGYYRGGYVHGVPHGGYVHGVVHSNSVSRWHR